MSEKQKSPFPMYRGKPLVRSGDTIYYGNMTDKYVIKIDIKPWRTWRLPISALCSSCSPTRRFAPENRL